MPPVSKVMGRMGLVLTTALMTVLSAFLSVAVAAIFGLFISVPNYEVHLLLSFIIPLFVTSCFSVLTALSIRDLQRTRRAAKEQALRDPLTGISNRRHFFEAAQSRGDSSRHGVLYIDIDHFKKINDAHGHAAGDAVLVHFATVLRSVVRQGDFVARIGGEEFAVHAQCCRKEELDTLAQRILETVRSTVVDVVGLQVRYTVSIGGAFGTFEHGVGELLSLADEQLYLVKQSGRDDVRSAALAGVERIDPEARPAAVLACQHQAA